MVAGVLETIDAMKFTGEKGFRCLFYKSFNNFFIYHFTIHGKSVASTLNSSTYQSFLIQSLRIYVWGIFVIMRR